MAESSLPETHGAFVGFELVVHFEILTRPSQNPMEPRRIRAPILCVVMPKARDNDILSIRPLGLCISLTFHSIFSGSPKICHGPSELRKNIVGGFFRFFKESFPQSRLLVLLYFKWGFQVGFFISVLELSVLLASPFYRFLTVFQWPVDHGEHDERKILRHIYYMHAQRLLHACAALRAGNRCNGKKCMAL